MAGPVNSTVNGNNYARLLGEQLQETSLETLPRDLVPVIISYLRPLMRPPLKENYQSKLCFGSPGSGNAQFNYPFAIAIGEDGTLFCSDCYNDRIQLFTPDGKFIKAFGSKGAGEGEFEHPCDMVWGLNGLLLVLDRRNHRVQAFDVSDLDAKFRFKFGEHGAGEGQLSGPRGITVDDDTGNIIVADSGNHRIQMYTPSGAFIRTFGVHGKLEGQLNDPTGLAVSLEGHIIVCDYCNHRIQVFSPSGEFLWSFGSKGSGECELKNPWGVKVDKQNHFIISEEYNNRIQVLTSRGEFVMTVGSKGTGFGRNNNGEVSAPKHTTIDSEGNLVVADCWVRSFGQERLTL